MKVLLLLALVVALQQAEEPDRIHRWIDLEENRMELQNAARVVAETKRRHLLRVLTHLAYVLSSGYET